MSQDADTEAGPPPGGVVQELARDDVERKKFLKNAGKMMGSGAAATGLAAFVAACGGSSKSSSLIASTETHSSGVRRAGHVAEGLVQGDAARSHRLPIDALNAGATFARHRRVVY